MSQRTLLSSFYSEHKHQYSVCSETLGWAPNLNLEEMGSEKSRHFHSGTFYQSLHSTQHRQSPNGHCVHPGQRDWGTTHPVPLLSLKAALVSWKKTLQNVYNNMYRVH